MDGQGAGRAGGRDRVPDSGRVLYLGILLTSGLSGLRTSATRREPQPSLVALPPAPAQCTLLYPAVPCGTSTARGGVPGVVYTGGVPGPGSLPCPVYSSYPGPAVYPALCTPPAPGKPGLPCPVCTTLLLGSLGYPAQSALPCPGKPRGKP